VNFGEKVKQLRAERNLTQPQLAQAIGIEQSYLSKLENDKSVPSADIFQAILRAFSIDVAAFLEGVDDKIVHRDLRQVPEVANHLNTQVIRKVHGIKAWLFTSAIACALGLTLAVAGFRGMLFANEQYDYYSPGVILPGEPTNLFEVHDGLLWNKANAGAITHEDRARLADEFAKRKQEQRLLLGEYRGKGFLENVPGGVRGYSFVGTHSAERPQNRWLMLAGALLTFSPRQLPGPTPSASTLLDLELIDELLAHALGGLGLGIGLDGIALVELRRGVGPLGLHGFERGLGALELILADAEREALLLRQFIDARLNRIDLLRHVGAQAFPLGPGGGQRGLGVSLARDHGILQRIHGLAELWRAGQHVLVLFGLEALLQAVELALDTLQSIGRVFLRVVAHVLERGFDLVQRLVRGAALLGATGHQQGRRGERQQHVCDFHSVLSLRATGPEDARMLLGYEGEL
jgi:transcriptional regulator with XRE-family HTH domain